MIYKGIRFRQSRVVVMLPTQPDASGKLPEYVDPARPGYAYFGRGVKKPEGKKNLVRTGYTWNDTKEAVEAKPIPLRGHSRSNMAYGKDGRIYLALDGACFVGR